MPTSIQPHELAELLKQQPVMLLDVRLPVENTFVALPDSVLIPLQELPARWRELTLKPDQTLVVYCHHGVRSWHAAAFLEQQGIAQVYSLEGGIEAWSCLIDPSMPRYS